jgi:hypothetical protein
VEAHDIRFKMVVFPAFALPIMRIRNLISWGTRGIIVLLLLVYDLELACIILCRGDKETRTGAEQVCDCQGMRRQIEPMRPPVVDGPDAGKHQLTTPRT